MADLKDALEARCRTFEPEPGGFDRLVRRRRNREVRRKVEAGVLAAAIALIVILGLQIASKNRPQQGPSVRPSNVGSLRQVWTAQLPDSGSAPVIVGDLAFVVADKLYAFPTSCPGSASCAPAWTGDIGGSSEIAPSVGDGVVVTTSPRRLTAFPASCATTTGACEPLWTAAALGPGSKDLFSSAVVRSGRVYATAADGLHVFRLHCRSDGGSCAPTWSGGYGSPEPPLVATDMVIVFASMLDAGHIDVAPPSTVAYPATCAHASCRPLWKTTDFYNDTPSGAAIDDDELIIGSTVVPRTHRPPSSARWVAQVDAPTTTNLSPGAIDGVTVAGGRVYLASDRVYAFPSHCATGNHPCSAIWKGVLQLDPLIGPRPWSLPVVANGLVFAMTDRPYAYAVDCGTAGETCTPLWVGPARGFDAPGLAVSGSHVIVTYSDGTIADFEPSTG